MNFEGSVVAWLMLAAFPIGLPVVLALVVAHLTPLKTGCLTFFVLAGLGVATAFGIAAYLDSRGTTAMGEVLSKNESVAYHPDGSWNRRMEATFRFRTGETDPYNTVVLNVLPERFDELHQGDVAPLRLPKPFSLFSITRLEDQTVLPEAWALICDQPFFFLFSCGLILMLGARFVMGLNLPTVFLIGGLIMIGAWWISDVGVPLWQQGSIRTESLNSVTATVKEIHPPYGGEGLRAWVAEKIYAPYDLILVDFRPLGQSQNLLAVDMVDPGSANLQVGQSLNNVEYSPGDSRFAMLPVATRDYLWKNALISTFLAAVAALGILKTAALLKVQQAYPQREQVSVDMDD